jgi:hypothetical protein
MAYVGTLDWAKATEGVIDVHDRIRLVGLAGRLLPALLGRLLYRPGRGRGACSTVDMEDLKPPATPATMQARTQLTAIAPDYLVNHCERTYRFSRLLAGPKEQRYDPELLYVASLAHDVGLCEPNQTPPDAQCFSIRGAQWATSIASASDWAGHRVRTLAQAITLNLNGYVPRRMGLEAHLMMRGVLLDTTGMAAAHIDPCVLQLFERLPRLDQNQLLPALFAAEAARHPGCRGHFALHWLGFGLLMRHPPW